MTREEAAEQIYGLILSADDEEGPCIFSDQIEALETAIEVLKQPEQKKGKWIYPSGIVGFGRCSECKALWDYSLITNRFFRHCPRCGAKIENCPFKDTEMEVEQ